MREACIILFVNFPNFSFDSPEFIWLIVSLIAIFLVLSISILVLILFLHQEKNHSTTLKDNSSSARIYVLDVKNDIVTYFNKSALKKMKKSSIVDFYNQFSANDRIGLVKWIGDLLNPKIKTNNYLEINVIERKKRRLVYSILQVQKIDYEQQLIHIESYLLRIKNSTNEKSRRFLRFSTQEAFHKAIFNSSYKKGVTFAIDLFYKNPEHRKQEFPRLAYAQVKNFVLNYATNRRLIMDYSNRQLIITDLDLATNSQTLRFIAELKSHINRILTISAFADEITFLFAIVNNKTFPKDSEKIISAVVQTAQLSEDGDQQIYWYDPDRSLEISNEQNIYRTEVERIIRDNKLKFKYRPVYNSERNRVIGYELFVKPDENTIFESIQSLKNYALKTGDDKELFSSIAKKGISRFIQEKDGVSLRLFFPLSYKERVYVARTFSYIQKIKESHIVLVFSHNELSHLIARDESNIIDFIHNLKVKGYETALSFDDYEQPFSKSFYQAFDYYIINAPYSFTDKNGQKQLASLRMFAEKLLHNNKNIITTNVVNWDNVELLIRIGLGNISSDVIAEASEMLLPIPHKSITKIKRIVESQGDKYGK